MNRCKTCRYWSPPRPILDTPPFGRCERVESLYDEPEGSAREDVSEELVVVSASHGYYARLNPTKDFGCLLWAQRPTSDAKRGGSVTDQEIICTWMEPQPSVRESDLMASPGGWWSARGPLSDTDWVPIFVLSNHRQHLGYLWEVEERLTNQLWPFYMAALLPEKFTPPFPLTDFRAVAHATAEQKVKALAAVLRPIVEAA